MSVGPVGPGGGIYPIIYDVVCKVNFQKLIWRPNINGYMQLCLCLWALSLFFKYTLYTTYPIIEYITPPGKQLWIFAVMLMSVGPVGPTDLTVVRPETVRSYSCLSARKALTVSTDSWPTDSCPH